MSRAEIIDGKRFAERLRSEIVGPMTIACLLLNTLEAACRQLDLPVPAGLMETAWG